MTQVTLWEMQTLGRSKTDLIRAFASLTPSKIVASNFPSIGHLNRAHGAGRLEKAMTNLVQDLNTSVGGPLKTHQMQEVATEISSDHLLRSMSLEDMYYALRLLKSENTHGSISVSKILKALRDHNKVRMKIVQSSNETTYLDGKGHDFDRFLRRGSMIDIRRNGFESNDGKFNTKK